MQKNAEIKDETNGMTRLYGIGTGGGGGGIYIFVELFWGGGSPVGRLVIFIVIVCNHSFSDIYSVVFH